MVDSAPMVATPLRIPLGPFELHRLIGKGGMAEVWRGRHETEAVDIAVKVITADYAHDERFRAAFRDEVRAVAGLSHPAVVMVLDHGEVSAEAERISRGRMVAGSPYLAMELATGGSLVNVRTTFAWAMLKKVLLTLLDGLAHAHARGVIHRDLKPGNILMASPGDMRPGLKLTDFGLAHALRGTPSETTSHAAGTLQYMAPEQFHGRWRDFGPWTDLYALGCLAWELATGSRPFGGETFWEVHAAHAAGPPAFPEHPGLPAGFSDWVLKLLRRETHERFQTAADAAWSLFGLDEEGSQVVAPSGEMLSAELASVHDQPTMPGDDTMFGASEDNDSFIMGLTHSVGPSVMATLLASDPGPVGIEYDVPLASLPQREGPPLPPDWRRAEEQISMRLVGAGLGLFGLRSIPLVDREPERDLMWETLIDVHRAGEARVLHLHGTAGAGKSRVVEWICERAHELGGAVGLRATHSPMGGPADGLSRTLAHHLRCVGLGHTEVAERCRVLLTAQGAADEYEWFALAQLIAPSPAPAGGPGVIFSTPTQRYVLMRRVLERIARRRPVIVWLDDAQWGNDSLGFVTYLMRTQVISPTPVLILVTTQDEALRSRTLESVQLERLLRLQHTASVEIAPLGAEDHSTLVQELLGLEGDLAHTVERRTAGNPLFAVQLVGDWVQRGVLEVGGTGFRLREGEDAVIPDDIHALVGVRLKRLLEGRPAYFGASLALAAALGQNVDAEEWSAAGAEAGIPVPTELMHDLVQHRLAVRHDAGWSFAHNMLRESLARTAREQRQWRPHNRACAKMLQKRHAEALELVSDRLGRYMLEAGETQEALQPLMVGAQHRTERSEFDVALELVDLYEAALMTLSVGAASPAWGEAWIRRALCHLEKEDFAAADVAAASAEDQAIEHGWTSLLPEIRRVRAHVLRNRGDLDGAERLFQAALVGFQETNSAVKIAGCLRGLGFVANQAGDLVRASDLISRAYALCVDAGREREAADCLQVLGIVAKKRGEPAEAVQCARGALEIYERVGYLRGQAHCHNGLAEVARYEGDFEAAERGYRQSLRLHEALGGDGSVPRMNLGLVIIKRGRYDDARRELEAVRRRFARAGRRQFEAAANAVLLPCYAAGGEYVEFDIACAAAARILQETNFVESDIAWPAQLAGELLSQAGEIDRARTAWELALGQWTALGDAVRAAEVARGLGSVRA